MTKEPDVLQSILCNHGVGLNLVTEQQQQSIYVIKAKFRKGRGTRDQIADVCWIIKKAREFQKNIYFCFINYPKVFDHVDQKKLWKILKEMGIPNCLLRICMQVKKQQLELDIEQQTGSKSGKEYIKAVLLLCLFNLYSEYIMQNACWMKHKLESRLPGEI